ncbi:MAG: hypothetical protein ACI4DP_01240 [Candidatus Ornithomonoglobus sp.]
MKIINKLAITAVAAAVIGAVNVYAYSDSVFSGLEMKPADGFYTVITDTEGEEHRLEGIIDTKRLENSGAAGKIASYAVYCGNEEIISVKLNDIISNRDMGIAEDGTPIVNGYYSVSFTLSETENTEVFLTGLSPSNIDTVQEQLISARIENSEFTMESLDFIDTEKTDLPDDGDNELCWAAGTANILHYTGWGQKAGFGSTDDILDCFRDSFTDLPGNAIYGLDWFFNGTYIPQMFDNWAHVKDYGESGAFLGKYESGRVIRDIYTYNNHNNMKKMTDALEGGSGIALSVGWMDENANRMGGHSITMWGYICDRNFSAQDKDYYKAVIISDSDSDMVADENRRMAPNKLRVLNLLPYSKAGYDTWQFDGYYGGIIEMAIMLEPYSDDTEFETDTRASLNKFIDADLTVSKIYVSNDGEDKHFFLNACAENESIYVVPKFKNTADADFDGAVDYTITVTDKNDGSEKSRINRTYTGRIDKHEESDVSNTKAAEIDGLTAGEYTVTVEVNPERSVTEAYYYNNTQTYDFTVSDKSYDLTDVSFSADVGEFVNGQAEAALTLEGYDTIDISQDAQSWLFVSYCEDGKWSAWSIADTPENTSVGSMSLMSVSVPESCLIYARGQKARLRLAVEPADVTEPLLNIYSDEIDLKYAKIGIAADETNTGIYTPLERAACSLADGELFAFGIKNASTYDCGEIACSAVVYAKKGGERVELFRQKDVSLAYGAEPIIISFSEWSDKSLSGTYEITVAAEGECIGDEVVLGTLCVKEQPSLTVTTQSDVTNEYDGLISLREAVSYAEEEGGTEIDFAEGVEMIFPSSPIVIDSDIKIKGRYNENRNSYTVIHGAGQTQLFKVTENGRLEGERLNITSGCSTEYGGAVENRGGTVKLDKCFILYSKSGKGGGIYSDGGSLMLSDCALKGNTAGYGGAVETENGAALDMIGCTLFANSSNGGAIYNNGGKAVIINSTFTDNTASSSGGGAVTSAYGSASMLGSIAVNNGENDIDGTVNVYGSYISAASDKAVVDDLTVMGKGERIFGCDTYGRVIWNNKNNGENISYSAYISSVINNGIYIKDDNGYAAYSADGSDWIVTDIESVFPESAYKTDIWGNERGRALGSTAEICEEECITDVLDGKVYIYAPRSAERALIEKSGTYDGIMTGVSVYKADIEPGTNIIALESIGAEDEVRTYMLWDSINGMCPKSNVFVY